MDPLTTPILSTGEERINRGAVLSSPLQALGKPGLIVHHPHLHHYPLNKQHHHAVIQKSSISSLSRCVRQQSSTARSSLASKTLLSVKNTAFSLALADFVTRNIYFFLNCPLPDFTTTTMLYFKRYTRKVPNLWMLKKSASLNEL